MRGKRWGVFQISGEWWFNLFYKHDLLLLYPSLYFFPFENYHFWNTHFCLFIGFMSLFWQGCMNIGLGYDLGVVCLLEGYLLDVSSTAVLRSWIYKRWNQWGDLQAIQYGSQEGIMRTQGLSGFPPVTLSSHKHSYWSCIIHWYSPELHWYFTRGNTHQNMCHVVHTFSISKSESNNPFCSEVWYLRYFIVIMKMWTDTMAFGSK